MKEKNLFGKRAMSFYDSLAVPRKLLPHGVEALYPHSVPETREYAQKFYDKFYADTKERTFAFGINPGRFGSGTTGIPFTDPVALQEQCGIRNTLEKRRETSSRFIYEVIESIGGVKVFYRSFFLTAVCPVGFIRDGKNYNYYDDPALLVKIKPFLVETIKRQISFGANRKRTIVLGTGANLKVFRELNNEFGFFETVQALEHPRFILQYRRKDMKQYLKKYQEAFEK